MDITGWRTTGEGQKLLTEQRKDQYDAQFTAPDKTGFTRDF